MKSCLLVLFCLFALVVSLPLAFRFGLITDQSISDRKTTKIVLSGGQVVSNDSYLESGFRELVRYNQLYFQENSSAPREKLSDQILIGEGTREVLPIDSAKVFEYADHRVVIIGSYIFVQLIPVPDKSPLWRQFPINPDVTATQFMRSFLKPDDKRLEPPHEFSGEYYAGVAAFERFPPYHFDHFSDDGKSLITQRPTYATDFPQYLAFKLLRYGDWIFDLDGTRAANHLTPLDDPHLIVDISIVIANAPYSYEQSMDRALVLTLPGAKEVFSESFPLSSTQWKTFVCEFIPPTGNLTIGVQFGFWDATPNYLSLRWQGIGTKECRMTRMDTWLTPFEGLAAKGVGKTIYFRVRKP